MGMSGAAITYLVERMIASGHFRRESDPADRRKVILRVADDGMTVARGFFTPLAEHNRRAMARSARPTTSPPRTEPSPRSSTRCGHFVPSSTSRDLVDEQLGGHRRPVGADPACHVGRPGAGLGRQRGLKRGGQRLEGRRRAVVRGADAEVGHPAGPVGLVRDLGDHHLWRAGPCGRRRGARAAVMHDGGHPAEQCLVVDLADGEAVVPVVDQRQVGPAAGEERAAALPADRLDGDPGDVLRGAARC